MNRRQYLETGIATIATGILAGCSGGGSGSGGGGGGNGTGGGSGGGSGGTSGGAATTGGGGAATTGGQGGMTTSGGTNGSAATTGGQATTGGTMAGGQTTTGGGAMTTGGGMTTGSGAPAVSVASNDEYGKILVGANSRSLYLFEKDKKGKSTCQGACAKAWPPLTVTGTPKKASGVTASLDTISRTDDSTQLTAAGHPLYYYAGDNKPGQTNGQGLKQFGAEWYLLAPDGSKIEKEGGEESGGGGNETTTSGSGPGY